MVGAGAVIAMLCLSKAVGGLRALKDESEPYRKMVMEAIDKVGGVGGLQRLGREQEVW